MKKFTLKNGIDYALNEVEKKIKEGKFFKANDESSESENFSNGDPETIYSIASMVSNIVETHSYEETENKIIEVLSEKYPDYM
jgi:hypothetical protein